MRELEAALELWTTTEPYSGFRSETIAWRLIPALDSGKYRVYWDVADVPRGFVSWAFLTREEFESGDYDGREVFQRESGDLFVVMDMIAPYGQNDVLLISRDLRKTFKRLYPDVETVVARRGPRTGIFPNKGG